MISYIVRRVLQAIPTVFIVGTVTFLAMRLAPGNPAEIFGLGKAGENPAEMAGSVKLLEKKLGIDKPYIVQYGLWLRDVFTGDLGHSFFNKVPVTTLIKQRLPKSVELAFVSLLLALPISLIAGVLAAVYRGSWIDNVATGFVTIGIAIPAFWLGIMMVILFSVKLEWLPSSGYVPFASDPIGHIRILIMPALTLAILVAAPSMRFLRASMLEVLNQDYIRTARAKGLMTRVVVGRHALKNAMIPTVTYVGLQFASLLSGTILIEWVFGWTGVGFMIVKAIRTQDYFVVQAGVMLVAVFFVFVNLAVDILYAFLDPRIRYG